MLTNSKILFRGTGFISWLICLAAMIFGRKSGLLFGGNGVVFSHIATVINAEDMTPKFREDYNLKRHRTYLTESTSISKCLDVFGNKISGVQIVPLEDKLKKYKGKCFYREITPKPSRKDLRKIESTIRKFYSSTKNTPYEKKRSHLILSQLDMTNIQLKEDITSLFCSEWCMLIDRKIGWTRGALNEITPTDYGNGLKLYKKRKFGKITSI